MDMVGFGDYAVIEIKLTFDREKRNIRQWTISRARN